ncbi:MAG TPA: hypothetical protein VFJ02_16560 [Vicinamibacterales bacterium]|nr:hypothetical protein [Vicinamibacterales bacterium]
MGTRFLLIVVIFSVWLGGVPAGAAGPNQLPNGSFEDASSDPETPDGWTRQRYVPGASLTWEAGTTHDGLRSVRISNPAPNDAAWTQTITLEPNRNYLLSGWIRTENVARVTDGVDAGANLCLWGTWQRTSALTGTNDWTYVRLAFNSGPSGVVSICARVGYWAGVTTGTAWFDDLQVREILATDPHPRWKILVLIYGSTDVTLMDESGTRHVYGRIEAPQLEAAAANASRFVNVDIPALSSSNMVPELTVRYPGALRSVTQFGNGWWPAPEDTAGDRDPSFDSVIVIWQPTVTDIETGQVSWIANAAGLTPPTGTGQTYTTVIVEAATLYGHLNVFKHEWGHSLLFYYDAAGAAPRPTVNNHTDGTTYVHCPTGAYYVWTDETDANPIPNSIYNNSSGFTHDYYSGTTALAADPMQCLGITPAAWATGGPVSKPGELVPAIPGERIRAIRALLQQLVDSGTLPRKWRRALEVHVDQAATALIEDDVRHATRMIELFRDKVLLFRRLGRLSAPAADALVGLADAIVEMLDAR